MSRWVLGLDGGGSKTLLAFANEAGEVVGPFATNGINPFDQPEWEGIFSTLMRETLAPGLLVGAALGLPGYGEVEKVSARQREMTAQLVGVEHVIVNDVQVAFFGALPDGVGVLLLAGTGSMAWGGDAGGRQARVGGWGERIGDEGSAFWIGQRALSLMGQTLDGRRPADLPFAQAMLERLNLNKADAQAALIAWTYSLTPARAGVASLASVVSGLAAQGDPAAAALLTAAADQLSLHVRALRARLRLPDSSPWSHAGSVFLDPIVRAGCERALGPPSPAALPPLGGALALAATQAGWHRSAQWTTRVSAALSAAQPISIPSGAL